MKVIFAVSDATGELAVNLATAALRQFREEQVSVIRKVKVRTLERIAKVVREAKENDALIVFTLVSKELRQQLVRLAAESKIVVIDIMGPMMDSLTQYFHQTPSDQPGLQYQIDNEYFKRNEAIEFAVKHDDGLGLETLDQAEIILLGISRTSKTPLSMYLAYRGFKTANIPIVLDIPLPKTVESVDRKKIVGLTISPEKLADLRSARLVRLRRSFSTDYADPESIKKELVYAQRIFSEIGRPPVIDVTSKAIEETASEVLTVLGL